MRMMSMIAFVMNAVFALSALNELSVASRSVLLVKRLMNTLLFVPANAVAWKIKPVVSFVRITAMPPKCKSAFVKLCAMRDLA